MAKTVILSGARTPFGKFGGALSSLSAAQLGGTAIIEALKRANVQAEDVQEVILGSVLQGGQGQIPSRQAAREAGLPWEVKTETINKVCASGMRSVTMADQIIRAVMKKSSLQEEWSLCQWLRISCRMHGGDFEWGMLL